MRDFTDLIRVAQTDEEKLSVYRFRYKIYVEEMGKPYDADHANRLLTDHLDEVATILYFESEGEVHGTVRINWGKDDVSHAAFNTPQFALSRFDRFANKALSFNSRLMISPPFRKSRLGLDLARRSYLLGLQNHVLFNFINCRPDLVEFFERLGFIRYHEPFVDDTAGKQIPMVLFLEDIGHLKQIRSPFLEIKERENLRAIPDSFLVPVWV